MLLFKLWKGEYSLIQVSNEVPVIIVLISLKFSSLTILMLSFSGLEVIYLIQSIVKKELTTSITYFQTIDVYKSQRMLQKVFTYA